MKFNNKGFSIIIGMGLVLLITLSAYVILSLMIPFSRNTKGIENASKAYYNAYSGIEQSLFHVNKIRPDLTTETGANMPSTSTGFSFLTFSSGTTIPKAGFGNSEYDNNYNVISKSEPLQLQVGKIFSTNTTAWDSNIKIYFKVPNLDYNSATTESLSGTNTPLINWTLSSTGDTLIASGTYLTQSNISNSISSSVWNIGRKNGFILDGSSKTFTNFYNTNCKKPNECILKFSIINDLNLSSNGNPEAPYLEYKIDFNGTSFPDRYTRIISSGKSYGFKKDLEVRIPQITVNQALDFTVFQ